MNVMAKKYFDIATKKKGEPISLEEVYEAGSIRIEQAVKLFYENQRIDIREGKKPSVAFSDYATWFFRQGIVEFLKERGY
jgi:DNA-directed RNA polymerase sigma subunit (sigma70/sigma32)